MPVEVSDPVPGERRAARVLSGDASTDFEFIVAEPGWTMFMISHFHYDPVWWNTQAAYTSLWTEEPPGRCQADQRVRPGRARTSKWRAGNRTTSSCSPRSTTSSRTGTPTREDRADLRRFIADGRVEIMGGTYNEPNTNLTSAETTIRNFVHGIGFQRDVLGADPATAWQLDVVRPRPAVPRDGGRRRADLQLVGARPAPPVGPDAEPGRPRAHAVLQRVRVDRPVGPRPAHPLHARALLGRLVDGFVGDARRGRERATYELFASLKKVALTRNVLLPVGTDYTPPNKWVTEIHRDWNARYTWPRFVCALPREFFAAVRAELDERGIEASPQTRDMNPIYTGKDVSYIDTKQANRDAENAVLDAERFAVFAGLLGGATYPQAALDKAWVQLAYGAHHDAITGSESDQVYLDLLTGWRDAWELGRTARDNALHAALQRRRRLGGGVERVGAQAHRCGDGAARRRRSATACG